MKILGSNIRNIKKFVTLFTVLQIAPNEQKAFHCKVICFIQLHNFKEALSILCNAKNAALASDLVFEKAYSQYRLNCPKEALETVDSASELTPALKELRYEFKLIVYLFYILVLWL